MNPRAKYVIEHYLEAEPETRNCDKLLTLRVIQHYLNDNKGKDYVQIKMKDFGCIPAFETIKRIRALFQNVDKKYLPTDPDVRTRRGIAEEAWREYCLQWQNKF